MSYEINLIEGERGKLHVTSDDARTKNALMFGTGRKVFNMDHAFEATMPDSNTVRITSGVFYDNGMFIRIDRDRYVEVPVDNGLPGTYRNDLICIRYERNIQTQLESASIVVKKGEASETKAVDPEYSVGDVLDLEVHLDEFPLYRVALDGITPKLEPMFTVEDVMSNISLYEEIISHIQDFDNPHQITSVNHAVTADKLAKAVKINGVAFDGTEDVVLPKVESDAALSTTSTNAVQNKVITAALNGKMPVTRLVSTTVDFDDLDETGIYLICCTKCNNAPTDNEYGMLIVMGQEVTGEEQQYFFPNHYGDGMVHTRYKYHGVSWVDWEILGLSTSQSTAITTAGTYALDAVQNNASISGTLANRTKTLEDTIGKIYTKAETVYGSGSWKTSGISLTVPAGVYVITRRGVNINGGGISLGRDYTAGSFITTPADSSTGVYTEIKNCSSSSNTIDIKYCSALNSTNKLELEAVRIK